DELGVFEMVTKYKALIESSVFLVKSLLQKVGEISSLTNTKTLPEGWYSGLSRMSELTDREVQNNLKELGIIIFDKEAVLSAIKKIEAIITATKDNTPVRAEDRAVILREMFLLSQILPEMYSETLCILAQTLSSCLGAQSKPLEPEKRKEIMERIEKLRIALRD
ncbi:MAG: hypothetical protein QME51_11370, partial [Planctomycetota bacterium]|nr:hypothetical protein [Planctomycetota bacterium]